MTSRGCSATSNPSPHHRPLTQRGRRSEATPGRSADLPTESAPPLQSTAAPAGPLCTPAGMDAPVGTSEGPPGASWGPVRWEGTPQGLRGLWWARFFLGVGSTWGVRGQLEGVLFGVSRLGGYPNRRETQQPPVAPCPIRAMGAAAAPPGHQQGQTHCGAGDNSGCDIR